MRELMQFVQAFAGTDATQGELAVWLGIVIAGILSGMWVGFEFARVAFKLVAACIKAVLPP